MLVDQVMEEGREHQTTVSRSKGCSKGCWRIVHVGADGRARLPDLRVAVTRKFRLGDIKGYLQVGFYPCGCPGELFIRCGHEGELVRGVLDAFATMFSIGLQHGAPVGNLLSKCLHTSFPPNGLTNDPDKPMAKSILDYVGSLIEGIVDKDHPAVTALREENERRRHLHGVEQAGLSEDQDQG
jgi:hypothetical protein